MTAEVATKATLPSPVPVTGLAEGTWITAPAADHEMPMVDHGGYIVRHPSARHPHREFLALELAAELAWPTPDCALHDTMASYYPWARLLYHRAILTKRCGREHMYRGELGYGGDVQALHALVYLDREDDGKTPVGWLNALRGARAIFWDASRDADGNRPFAAALEAVKFLMEATQLTHGVSATPPPSPPATVAVGGLTGMEWGDLGASDILGVILRGRGDDSEQEDAAILHVFGLKPPGKQGRWGQFNIRPIDRPRRYDHHRGHRGGMQVESGVRIRQLHRAATDGRCFYMRRKLRGGTVLVDVSGSMGLTDYHLQQFLKRRPAATLAAYGGTSWDSGVVAVLAMDGTMVEEGWLRGIGFASGNVVDGPALRWLATQRRPLFWVSDGDVTGVGDEMFQKLTYESRVIAAQSGIKRFKSLNDLYDHLGI